jgi:hypothetical protein
MASLATPRPIATAALDPRGDMLDEIHGPRRHLCGAHRPMIGDSLIAVHPEGQRSGIGCNRSELFSERASEEGAVDGVGRVVPPRGCRI